ncbi:MAG: helix-turn-helix domain-containing protein [Micromonosporaceae bacterium]
MTAGPDRPKPVEQDSRGILDPWLMRDRVRLVRYPASPALAGLIDRFWTVQWDLPPSETHRQQVLTHPGANFSVGDPGAGGDSHHHGGDRAIEARLNGVARRLTTRVLAGQGWTVAAMARPGGLGAFVTRSASEFTDRVVPFQDAISGIADPAALAREIGDQTDQEARVAVLASALERAVLPEHAPGAQAVSEIAKVAETDRTVRRLSDLSARAGIGQRTLQRMFSRHAGVSPTWVLRRYRLLDAAEAARAGEPVPWAAVASDLGYADQAHLIRDFRDAIGQTPAAYAEAQRPG